jgi:hypothetical protein
MFVLMMRCMKIGSSNAWFARRVRKGLPCESLINTMEICVCACVPVCICLRVPVHACVRVSGRVCKRVHAGDLQRLSRAAL